MTRDCRTCAYAIDCMLGAECVNNGYEYWMDKKDEKSY